VNQNWYQTRKREGKCPFCGGAPTKGKVRCEKCRDSRSNYRKQRRLLGLCRDCSNPTPKGRARCLNCRVLGSTHLRGEEQQKAVDALKFFNGACWCCSSRTAGGAGEFHVDHKDDRFRGILCHNCNVSLGMLGDDENRILLLLSYLRKTAKKSVELKG